MPFAPRAAHAAAGLYVWSARHCSRGDFAIGPCSLRGPRNCAGRKCNAQNRTSPELNKTVRWDARPPSSYLPLSLRPCRSLGISKVSFKRNKPELEQQCRGTCSGVLISQARHVSRFDHSKTLSSATSEQVSVCRQTAGGTRAKGMSWRFVPRRP